MSRCRPQVWVKVPCLESTSWKWPQERRRTGPLVAHPQHPEGPSSPQRSGQDARCSCDRAPLAELPPWAMGRCIWSPDDGQGGSSLTGCRGRWSYSGHNKATNVYHYSSSVYAPSHGKAT
eukprot:gene1483-biopygen2447